MVRRTAEDFDFEDCPVRPPRKKRKKKKFRRFALECKWDNDSSAISTLFNWAGEWHFYDSYDTEKKRDDALAQLNQSSSYQVFRKKDLEKEQHDGSY